MNPAATHHKDIAIILPTRNEEGNIVPIVDEIESAFAATGISYEVIFVDDSTDKTPQVVDRCIVERPQTSLSLIHRPVEERNGLGGAVLLGFALTQADVVCVMDSDLQHPPAKIIEMYKQMFSDSVDMVVASRMIETGSAAGLSSLYRHIISRASRLVTWIILPATKKTSDPMTGFFMFRKDHIIETRLNPIGFKILVEMLARIPVLQVSDVPFVMRKRALEDSNASLQEGFRFFKHLAVLLYETRLLVMANQIDVWFGWLSTILLRLVIGLTSLALLFLIYKGVEDVWVAIIITVALILAVQGFYALFLMVYAWENPERALADRSPTTYTDPKISFTTLLPVRQETEVVADTIKAITNIDYPKELTEVKVICSDEDVETITAVKKAIDSLLVADLVSLIIYDHRSGTSKPKAMNIALAESKNDVVTIFDAEDEPHRDIFNIINTVMLRDGADVVQSGVQLMNYRSNWFSMFNVMEYYFWFKSALHFYASVGVIPLGGNTVFFNRQKLLQVGGWDEKCLTEDGDVGLRLSSIGANIRVIYDEQHVTREETPPTIYSFVKQRTRWNQGFLQILLKREWMLLPTKRQQLLAIYMFTWPVVHSLLFLYIPFALYIAATSKIPIGYAMIANIPLYVFILHFVTFSYGLFQFTRDYKLSYTPWLLIKSLIFYFPYQILLGVGALRAVVRLIRGNLTWEKTEHTNAHRRLANNVAEAVVASKVT